MPLALPLWADILSQSQLRQSTLANKYSDYTCDYTERSLQETGFSEDIAARLSVANAPGTRNVYQFNWRHWLEWCSGLVVDLLHPSSPDLADFLTQKFDNRLAADTIASLCSSVGGTIRADFGGRSDPSADPNISRLLQLFARERHNLFHLTPPWNLFLSWILYGSTCTNQSSMPA